MIVHLITLSVFYVGIFFIRIYLYAYIKNSINGEGIFFNIFSIIITGSITLTKLKINEELTERAKLCNLIYNRLTNVLYVIFFTIFAIIILEKIYKSEK